MNKSILLMSFLGITLLLVFGLFWPASPAVWLASTSREFAALRVVLLAGFGLLIVASPPRSVLMREMLILAALITGIWAIGETYNNQMKFLDSLSLLEFSVCATLAAFEQTGEEFLQSVPSRKAAMAGAKHKKVAG